MTDLEIDRRVLLTGGIGLSAAAAILPRQACAVVPVSTPVRIQRLEWAGIRIEMGDSVAYIDATAPESAANNPASFVSTKQNRHALITHEHGDHYDPAYLASLIGEDGTLICQKNAMANIERGNFRVRRLDVWQPAFMPRSGSDMVAI